VVTTGSKYLALLAVISVTLALDLTGLLAPLDRRLLDAEFQVLRAWFPQPAHREVVVVGVDAETVARFPEPIALWHRHLGRFLAAMTKAGPSVVGIDIVLPDRSFDGVLPGSDGLLLKSMVDARRVFPLVLALTADPAGQPRPIHAPFLSVAGAEGTGYALFPMDGDGRVRRFSEGIGANGERVPTLAGQMARRLGIEPGEGVLDYWRGAPFEYVPFHQVLAWMDANETSALAQAFAGKPVLLGIVLSFADRHRVPVSLAAWEPAAASVPGVVLQAHALRTLLQGGLIRPVPRPVMVGAVAGAALLWLVSMAGLPTLLTVCVAGVLLLGGAMWLITLGWHFPVAAPMLGITLAAGGRYALDTMSRLRERRRLRGAFSGYVSPGVMDEILAGRIVPKLGGESRFVCIMFSDIRGYTTRSEHMGPDQVIAFLNRYFERVVALIHARSGSVVSFMGDGIMAVFGAPKALENPCRDAFETAREMLGYVQELNQQFRSEGEEPLAIGIGLHAGDALVGHVGSTTRHDYTAIGDATNVASRLESLTKEAGYSLVISKVVAVRLGGKVQLDYLGPMAIKGHSPVEAYGYGKT
jgi:adenylate cyclase